MAIQRAVFSGTDLDQGMAREAQLVLDRAPTLSMFFDRSQEAEVRTKDNAIIDNYHFDVDGAAASTMALVSVTEKQDFLPSKEFSISQQSWKMDQFSENTFRVYESDTKRSGRGNARVSDGSQHMRNLAVAYREDNILAYMNALSTYSTTAPGADDLPKLDNSGANGNAGSIHTVTLGAAANTVDAEGALNGNNSAQQATADALINGLASLRTRIRRRNVGITEEGSVIGTDPGTFAFLCPPEVGRSYNEALRIRRLQGEQLNRQLYASMGTFVDKAFEFQINNLASFSSTALPVPATATGGFTCYLLTNKAIRYAEEDVMFWSQAPNSRGGVNPGPFYSYHQRLGFARKLVNPECMIKVIVRTA